MQQLEQYLQTYFNIKSVDLSPIADLFEEQTVSKNEFILKEGQYGGALSFVKEGFIRMYALNPSGKEITQWVASQGMFVVDLSGFLFDTPSRWNIVTLTEVQLYTISKSSYQQLNHILPNWKHLENLFLSKCFVTLENRVFNQLSMTAEEKYIDLFNSTPEIFNQVPLQYIASMLGMTPETLSRIRNKMIS